MTSTLLRVFPVLALLAGPAFAQGGFLGVRLGAPDDAQDVPGASIAEVLPHGPAAIAGLRSGDLVVRVDDRRIADARSLAEAVASYDPGDVVELGVVRDGEDVVVPVVLGKRPAASAGARARGGRGSGHAASPPDDAGGDGRDRARRGIVILRGPEGAVRLDDEALAELLEELDLDGLEDLVESHGLELGEHEGHGWFDHAEDEAHGWLDRDEDEDHGWFDHDEDEARGWFDRDEDACPECDTQRERDRIRERRHGGPDWSERGRRGHGPWGERFRRGVRRPHGMPMGPGMDVPFGLQGPGFDPRALEEVKEMMERMRAMHESMLRDLERRLEQGGWSMGSEGRDLVPFAPGGSVFDLRLPEGAQVRAHVVYPASTPESERERLVEEARERWGDDVEVEFRGDATVISVQVEAWGGDDPAAPSPWPDEDDTEDL